MKTVILKRFLESAFFIYSYISMYNVIGDSGSVSGGQEPANRVSDR